MQPGLSAKMATSVSLCWQIFPGASITCVLTPTVSKLSPASPGDSPRYAGMSGPGSCGVTALPWVPAHVKSCVRLPRVESLLPRVLCSYGTQSPWAFKVKLSGGSSSQCQMLWLGNLTWGLELSLLGESLRYNYFPVCGSPIQWIWNLIILWKPSYHLVVVSSFSLGVETITAYFKIMSSTLLLWFSLSVLISIMLAALVKTSREVFWKSDTRC